MLLKYYEFLCKFDDYEILVFIFFKIIIYLAVFYFIKIIKTDFFICILLIFIFD